MTVKCHRTWSERGLKVASPHKTANHLEDIIVIELFLILFYIKNYGQNRIQTKECRHV